MHETEEQGGDSAFRVIFEEAPVALWDEDFSGVRAVLDRVTGSGITDLSLHLRERPDVIQECVQQVRVRHVNRLARGFYGAESEEQLIATLPSLFDDMAFNVFREELIAFADGARTFESELSVSTISGERRRVVMNVSIIGTVALDWSRVIVAFTDISERRRLEQSLKRANETLRRLNQHLEQFAYAAAHDLREPLRTIGLYTQLLQRQHPPGPGTPAEIAFGHILNNAHRMETLVADLLTFARTVEPQAGDAEELESDPHAVLTTVLSSLSMAVQESAARIHVDPDLPKVSMRAIHLRQVFQNLLSNAIKYRAHDRELVVRITAETIDGAVAFCVADNGIGIKAEYYEQIFGIFKRLHGYEIQGNGIGLALCRKIVEDYGGRIRVQSTPDQGSRFCFTVPSTVDGA